MLLVHVVHGSPEIVGDADSICSLRAGISTGIIVGATSLLAVWGSAGTELLYVQPELDAFSTLVRGEMRISNPRGLTIVVSTARKMCRSQRSIFAQRNDVGTSVRNLKGKRSTVAKMCCLVQRAIFIVIKL